MLTAPGLTSPSGAIVQANVSLTLALPSPTVSVTSNGLLLTAVVAIVPVIKPRAGVLAQTRRQARDAVRQRCRGRVASRDRQRHACRRPRWSDR